MLLLFISMALLVGIAAIGATKAAAKIIETAYLKEGRETDVSLKQWDGSSRPV